jgi:hypothetical protein
MRFNSGLIIGFSVKVLPNENPRNYIQFDILYSRLIWHTSPVKFCTRMLNSCKSEQDCLRSVSTGYDVARNAAQLMTQGQVLLRNHTSNSGGGN